MNNVSMPKRLDAAMRSVNWYDSSVNPQMRVGERLVMLSRNSRGEFALSIWKAEKDGLFSHASESRAIEECVCYAYERDFATTVKSLFNNEGEFD